MNKYQDALDKIKSCTNIIIDKGENYTLVKNQVPQECFDSLQELIDNYGAMYEESFEHARFLKEVVEPHWEEVKKSSPVTILQSTDKEGNFVGNTIIDPDYEKALDKACKFYHDFYTSESELTTEQWKEWLLRDE